MKSLENMKSFINRYYLMNITGFLTFLIILGVWQYYKFHRGMDVKEEPIPVSVYKVTQEDLERQLELVGSVYPYETVKVHPRLDSQITKINFHHGDWVEKDQVLFELDDRLLKAQLSQQQAILQRDKAELDRAKQKYERDKKLSKKGITSTEQLETSRQSYEASVATVQADEAQIDSTKTQLDYTILRSPIQGRAGTINLTVGNVVKTTDIQPLVTINTLKPIQVQVSIPQDSYQELRTAQNEGPIKMVVFNEKKEPLETGVLEYRENTLDEQTRTLVVRGIFANKEETLWPQMFVDVLLVLGVDKGVLTVPLVAVQNGQKGPYIFIVKNYRAYKKDVRILRIQKDKAILEGELQEGDWVVTDGVFRLNEGSLVSLYEAKTPSDSSYQKGSS